MCGRFALFATLLILGLSSSACSTMGSLRDSRTGTQQFKNRSEYDGAHKKYSLKLDNVFPGSRLFIDPLSSPLNHLGFIDVQSDLLPYEANGTEIVVDFEAVQKIGNVQNLCVKHKNGKVIMTLCKRRPSISGIRAVGNRVSSDDDGAIHVPENDAVTLFFFGSDLSINTEMAFTSEKKPRGTRCEDLPLIKIISLIPDNVLSNKNLKLDISLPTSLDDNHFYVCLRDTTETNPQWVHQGDESWLAIRAVGRFLPIELLIVIICFLIVLSGLFSGLNLGLMALECTELKILEKCGNESEKKHAKKIYPVRKKSNYLLCSLLLGNVLVNNSLTLLLDEITSGVVAIILSTFVIVIIGEIIPQALCSRHGLAIGAKTLCITKIFMVLTFPLSYPISRLLDVLLGEEIRTVYNRKRLMEFIRLTKDDNDLHNDEVDIISGALELSKKTVSHIMTKINDVFMVPITTVLNFDTVSEIIKQGYSRIPVYDGERDNVVSILNIKDLAFVDPDTETHLKTLCEFYNHPVNFVFEDTTLDVMLNEFKKGRSHMAFVRRVNNEEDGDPYYQLIGIVTLEDVIEEIIQSEIIDETDVLTDNRRKRVRRESQVKQDFSDFSRMAGGDKKGTTISPQLALATYQYLSTSVGPFKNQHISEVVLKKLMAQDVYFKSKTCKDSHEVPASNILFQTGKQADYFILILEGRCLVTVSKEKLVFETGPFSVFGLPAITVSSPEPVSGSLTSLSSSDVPPFKPFIPDYTVVASTETVYMKVHYAVYLSARRATQLERHPKLDSDSIREETRVGSRCNSQSSLKNSEGGLNSIA
ncbi:hypothetical protein JTE90_001938 [Oedothorax gibbosus]|uniref:Metal transporter CNNM4 n=1 Tax=Oedothorax gibbosus TaxID=931172 RepID=A0AAV6VT43_9ARAC|nr:hypothetical protein JTE90_001938 [Oedothorax gibbosus]